MKHYPIMLLMLFSIKYASSQNLYARFQHLDIDAGISQNHIIGILQDSRGFMWFGTRDGLNKYDGYQFTIYRHDPKDSNSISNDFITAIVEDSKGFIWIATRGGGLDKYDRVKNRFTHFSHDAKNENSISSNLIDAIAKDADDNLWICTENNGVDVLNTRLGTFTHYQHSHDANSICDNNTRCLQQDAGKNWWIGGYGGLNYFNTKKKIFTRYYHNPNDSNSISDDNVKVIFEDSRKRIWIGTDGGGLDLVDKTTNHFKHFKALKGQANTLSANVIAAIAEDKYGNIWIGTENGGLDILNPATGKIQVLKHDDIDSKSISQNSIYSIYKDSHDDMWVGTYAGGVNIFSAAANRFVQYYHNNNVNSLSNNNVLCIRESKNGKLWIGTDGGGLDQFDPVTKSFKHFRHSNTNSSSICGDYVLDVLEDSKGNLWIGTWGDGLTVFNPSNNTYRHFKNNPKDSSSINCNNVWTIMEDKDNNIWVGTYGGGLNLFNPVNNSFSHFDSTSADAVLQQIFSIIDDGKHNLYIGTDGGGLRIFNKKSKTFSLMVHDSNSNSISDNRINYLYADTAQNIWIGTMNGLDCLHSGGKITHYTTENGLPNNVIFGIAEDNNKNLWISTNKGLSQFNQTAHQFKNYGPADGLQSYEFKPHSVCKSQAGAFYFGGIKGFNQFYPAAIEDNNTESSIVFTDFEIFNKKIGIAKDNHDPSPLKQDINETSNITLSYKDAVISFEFAALNFSAGDKRQYAYLMEGFDKDWNYIGSKHSATFTNLYPGNYIFYVKAKNNNGEWSTHVRYINITITPPFWLSWWFGLLLLGGFITGVIFFNRYRFNRIQQQKILLQQKVDQQTTQLITAANEEKKAREAAEKAKLQAENANREMAQKNKEIEQFVYIASHDLQEPLRTTSSFVDILQRQYAGKLDEKADKYFNFITDASARMKTLIKDLLDYSRIGAKKDVTSIDCNTVMKAVLADLGTAINHAHAFVTVEHLPIINGYNTEIKQLFQNLVINAIKFRKKDVDPRVRIYAKELADYWEFAVADNGIGIAEEYKERIFLIFQRLHTKTEYEGSGIGLAHCKKIVEIHGGQIWLQSIPGTGTTFYFTIPKHAVTG